MKEGDLDIVQLIIENMPEENNIQMQIKLYLQMHKTTCNDFVYARFKRSATTLNAIFQELRADLGREVLEVLQKKGEI